MASPGDRDERKKTKAKFIFVTGGVLSSLGKGLAASSIGALMESRGLRVTLLKMDPYINVDPGTMNPYQHGEVFVTDDGTETDLDLGHYERFTQATMGAINNFTTGQVYESVIAKERRGEYRGGTVQVIPHITDEIKDNIGRVAQDVDIVIVEVGGTVGDIESHPFLEAIRQFRADVGRENVLYVHVTLVPYVETAGELKTKPTQHSVKELREIGIQPDLLLGRSDRELTPEIKAKIALYCNLDPGDVISAVNVPTVYAVPLALHQEGLDDKIVDKLGIWARRPDLSRWEAFLDRYQNPTSEVTIGLVGKYVHLVESYKSLNEALLHGGVHHRCRIHVKYIDSETLEGDHAKDPQEVLGDLDAILVPGGFGKRGVEGKITAIRYARENQVPFLGICLGMQLAVVEFARNVADIANAGSSEFHPHCEPVVDIMKAQKAVTQLGGTMRLGAYPCTIAPRTLAAEVYGKTEISERHRHRYEFNNAYRKRLERKGLVVSGTQPEHNLVEIIELKRHPWFLGCQFHPEFKSRPFDPHPLFSAFVGAAIAKRQGTLKPRRSRRRTGTKGGGSKRTSRHAAKPQTDTPAADAS